MLPRLAVPVSGTGSLLNAMIADGLTISLVIADRECKGIEIAKGANIPTLVLPRSFKRDEFDRPKYTGEVLDVFMRRDIALVAMAGFMTVFAPVMFTHYANKITNIHPALLPAFKGDKAVADALAFGVKITGTTVHYATEKLDDGPIIAQEAVPVMPGDTVETLHERIKVAERRIYPIVIRNLLSQL
jgi:phosphoribosylglycinamide formyltransferase-1